MFLNGNFVALSAFQQRYGVPSASSSSGYAIPTKWQSALFQSGQCGAFVGVFLAGPITNRIGYRWTTILGLMCMNATIFISFFVSVLTSIEETSPNQPPLGRLSHLACGRTSLGRRSLGTLHCQLSCLRQRNCSPRTSRCLHGDSANELVYRFHHRCRRYLWL